MNQNKSILFWAGFALAIGSFGVVLASVFYALSPVSSALPIPNVSMTEAYQGMITGRVTMMLAGIIGVISDVILITGALLLLIFRTPAALQIEKIGWALMALGVTIFIFVDSLSAGVLTQLAVLDESIVAFAGFKLLFDILFVFGTVTVSLGAPAILLSEIKAEKSALSNPLSWLGMLFSLAGLISSILYFANYVSIPQLIGISIAGLSLVFSVYGIQIARSNIHLKEK